MQSSLNSPKDVERGEVYQPLTLSKLVVAHLPLPEEKRKFAEYIFICIPYPWAQKIAKICILLSHNNPEWKILKVKSEAIIHDVAASLQTQIHQQHYMHIVHKRQLAKLPILGGLVTAHFKASGPQQVNCQSLLQTPSKCTSERDTIAKRTVLMLLKNKILQNNQTRTPHP